MRSFFVLCIVFCSFIFNQIYAFHLQGFQNAQNNQQSGGSGDPMSNVVGGLSNGVQTVMNTNTDLVMSATHEFANRFDDKLRMINDGLQPYRDAWGRLVGGDALGRGGNSGAGGFGGFGGGLGGGLGGGFGGGGYGGIMGNMVNGMKSGLNSKVSNKLNMFGGSWGDRIVYQTRMVNNRNAVYAPISNTGCGGQGSNGPQWIPGGKPGAYIGVNFTPDPCPQNIPPCGTVC